MSPPLNQLYLSEPLLAKDEGVVRPPPRLLNPQHCQADHEGRSPASPTGEPPRGLPRTPCGGSPSEYTSLVPYGGIPYETCPVGHPVASTGTLVPCGGVPYKTVSLGGTPQGRQPPQGLSLGGTPRGRGTPQGRARREGLAGDRPAGRGVHPSTGSGQRLDARGCPTGQPLRDVPCGASRSVHVDAWVAPSGALACPLRGNPYCQDTGGEIASRADEGLVVRALAR